jgi:hypothetical protein
MCAGPPPELEHVSREDFGVSFIFCGQRRAALGQVHLLCLVSAINHITVLHNGIESFWNACGFHGDAW